MIGCESFRERFSAGCEDAVLLGHLRACDRCLDHAASIDPDVMFRSLGGADMIPPGGLDAFVDGVMQQVRVRSAETTVTARPVAAWPRWFAIAAALAVLFSGTLLFNRIETTTAPSGMTARSDSPIRTPLAVPASLATKPVVETYESRDTQNATIIEMPGEASDEVKLVMIFDENLPADL